LTNAPKTYRKEKGLFNKCCWENWISACRKLKPDPGLPPCTRIYSKWIKDLNIRPETLRLVQERAGNTLELIGIVNDFLNRIQMAQQLRERTEKWNYMKLKSFLIAKEGVTKLKQFPIQWEKIFAS
jgi:hypothetical protein